jgi:3-oxo-5alpha-steroid 4-dehydrogenase
MAVRGFWPPESERSSDDVDGNPGTPVADQPRDGSDRGTPEARDLSRRALLQGAGSLSLASLVARYAPAQLQAAQAPSGTRAPARQWDMEADVVVVGYGAAGGAAAVAAVQGGASVIVLERAAAGGGSSRNSAGTIVLGGGTPTQKAAGFNETPDKMYAYLSAALGLGADPDLVRAYCDGSVDLYHWLVSLGIVFSSKAFLEKVGSARDDTGLYYAGSETAFPYNELTEPTPHGHRGHRKTSTPEEIAGPAGFIYTDVLMKTAEAGGAKVVYKARGKRLVMDGDRVVGIEVMVDGAPKAVHARNGVVLACGGFQFNKALLSLYAPLYLQCTSPLGQPNEDGDGLLLGMGAGAQTVNLDRVSPWRFIYPPGEMCKGMYVDAHGRRFVAEDLYGGNCTDAMVRAAGGTAYFIIDQAVFDEVDAIYKSGKLFAGSRAPNIAAMEPTAKGRTLQELATALKVPPAALTATFATYNRNAARGDDTEFHKQAHYLQPLDKPPYYAYDHSPRNSSSFMTLGGLKTDRYARVQNHHGRPIPGLYAAGRTAAGIMGWFYNSGTSMGDCLFFGRTAGRHAAGASKVARVAKR